MTGADTGWPTPEPPPRARDGCSPLERYAVARLGADVAAMPASDVVQLVLWPDTIANWARQSAVAPAVAYNMLSRFKPYRRVREILARRLDVPGFVLDHLVDAARPLPSALRLPEADRPDASDAPAPEPPRPPRGDAVSPTIHLPALRDGTNPLEQRALWRVWRDAAALPASVLVQVALFPETLAEWARRQRVPAPMLYAMLAGTQPHPGLRAALARRLGVPVWAVDRLVDGTRREPVAPPTSMLAEPPADRPHAAMHVDARDDAPMDRATPPSRRPPAGHTAPPDADQLSLGF